MLHLQDRINIVRLLLAAVGINGSIKVIDGEILPFNSMKYFVNLTYFVISTLFARLSSTMP